MSIPLSILDLAPVASGSTASQALRNTVDLARLADDEGYTRYWLAEHHGMPSIASSSPEILIEHVASRTERIRVGSGGIMLPNHVPLKVAESFHTLEALHPGRIDLGIGRAPGSDPTTAAAMRPFNAEQFAAHLAELVGLSRGDFPIGHPFRNVRVIPADVELPPIWLLGSSGASARLAASLGMGYAFASHFSPTPPGPAVRVYREAFRPSPAFSRPHAILGVAAIVADTEEHAEYLASSSGLGWVRLQRGEYGPLPSPEEALAYPYTAQERAVAAAYRRLQVVGTARQVHDRIDAMVNETGADEIIVVTMVHGHAPRLRSYQLLAAEFGLRDALTSRDGVGAISEAGHTDARRALRV
ncbi:MAG TPA: LLM class flavin-dependent oxidoreductase [Gemmatimonadaceae bacterium]|nr:LLM class flavin-dependent oxidoreductase [Gemmatimonadaceae bacterium]